MIGDRLLADRARAIACLVLVAVLTLLPGPGQGNPLPDSAARDVEIIPLHTGTAYRFKGLAVAPDGARFFLGSWDRKQIVAVRGAPSLLVEFDSPYRGRLNGMGVYLRGNTLYAVMNKVDDGNAQAVSALVLFDIRSGKTIRSHELRGDGSGRHHFNHVIVDADGRAYISNTLKSGIWTIDTRDPGARLEHLIVHPGLRMIHGIAFGADERTLYVTSYEDGLGIVDLDTLHYESLQQPDTRGNDGIAYHRGFIYAVGQNALTRHRLDGDGRRVLDSIVLLRDHPQFNDPRCLQIVDDSLFILANIEHAPVSFRQGGFRRRDWLTDTFVLRYPLGR